MTPPPAFTLTGATFHYRAGRRAVPVLDRLTAAVPAGGVTAVLGSSGSGKTTLLSLLGLLWDRGLAGGRIAYHPGGGPAQEYDRLSAARRAALRRTEFGFVLQSCYLLPHFSCVDNIAMPLALQGVAPRECRRRVDRLVGLVDAGGALRADLGRRAGGVSGGQKQRTAVLRAVVHDPAVLFADEPVSNLDAASADRVLELFRLWRSGGLAAPAARARARTLVLVTHDVDLAFRQADHFLLLWPRPRGPAAAPTPACWVARADVPGPAALRRALGRGGPPADVRAALREPPHPCS